jgi:hypothetical protein
VNGVGAGREFEDLQAPEAKPCAPHRELHDAKVSVLIEMIISRKLIEKINFFIIIVYLPA